MRSFVVLAIAALLAGCASPSVTETTGHVQGTATIGPTTPVCRIGEPCSGPYSGRLALMNRDGTRTELEFQVTNGTFAFDHAPGDYTIRHAGEATWPRCQSPVFTVKANAKTMVAVDCDSGIR